MFVTHDGELRETGFDGIRMKTLSYGDRSMMTEFRLAAGSVLPVHEHPHEQTGYLVDGHIRLTIGDELCEVRAGDSWCIPGGVAHGAEVVVDAVAVEVFSPLRDDFLPGTEPSGTGETVPVS